MSKKVIVIIGVTGNQGSSVAERFLKDGTWIVRGISRDPSKSSAQAVREKGVEVITGDLDNTASIATAVAGADVIFGTTDFWAHMHSPDTHSRAEKEGRSAHHIAHDLEVAQGRNLIDAVAQTTTSLSHFIISTLNGSKQWSKGKILHNLHFDTKALQIDYLREKYPELWTKTSRLNLGVFMSNWKIEGAHAPTKVSEGVYRTRMAMSGDRKLPMVDVRDTGTLVHALVLRPAGIHLQGAGSLMSWNEWVAVWAKHNNVTCTFEQKDRKEMDDQGELWRGFADMLQYYDEFGYAGGDPTVVYPCDLGIEELTTVEQYIATEDWTPIL